MIGEKVRRLRLEKKMSLTKLAERANVSKTYLSNIERNNQTNPSVEFVIKVSAALDIPVVDLLEIYIEEMERSKIKHLGLDEDLVRIVKELMEIGVTKDQLKEYLEFQRWRREPR